MSLSRLKAPSTKAAQPVPPEFEPIFIEQGWQRAEYLFGKRAAKRWFTVLGPDRLRAARAAHRAAEKDKRRTIELRRKAGARN